MTVQFFLTPGDRVGAYEIHFRLGSRMVYLGQDKRSGRRVTLQVLPAGQEATAASALNHPNIITIYEIVEAEARGRSVTLIVMEPLFPSVTSIRESIGHPLPLDRLIHVGGQIADALDAAHAAGIVHGSLNLENILVQLDGQVKILGFGLARPMPPISFEAIADEIVASGDHDEGARLAAACMAPEQAGGSPSLPAVDLFSLGVVLYTLATGQHPFQAARNAAIPEALDALIQRLIEKDPVRRQTAAEAGRTLRELTGSVKQSDPDKTDAAREAEWISTRIPRIDDLVADQLQEIMRHPSFQKLEATWRGLKGLVDETATDATVKIRILNCSQKELRRDLERAPQFEQSAFFEKVNEWRFAFLDGEPFGVLVGDYEFGRRAEDVQLLEQVSHVAAAAHSPFIAGAAPDLFESPEYEDWKRFRQSRDSRYTALTLPRFLGRWVNSAYALAAHCADISGRADGLYETDEHNRQARLDAQLPYILAASRFAHYLQAIIRDCIGALVSRADAENLLNRWINRYVVPAGDREISGPHYPLLEARVEISEIPGSPGMYRAAAYLTPQLKTPEELTVSMRVDVDLPPQGGGRQGI